MFLFASDFHEFNEFLLLCAIGLILVVMPFGIKVIARIVHRDLEGEEKIKAKSDTESVAEGIATVIKICLLFAFARFMYNMAIEIFAIIRLYI